MFRHFLLLFSVFLGLAVHAQEFKPDEAFWIYPSFENSHAAELRAHLESIRQLNIESPGFTKFNAIAQVDAKQGLMPWLQDRVRLFYPDHVLNTEMKRGLIVERKFAPSRWDHQGEYSKTEILGWFLPMSEVENENAHTGALNLGAAVAAKSQSEGQLYSLVLPGVADQTHPRLSVSSGFSMQPAQGGMGRVLIKSPRVGIVVLGDAYFLSGKEFSEALHIKETLSERVRQIFQESMLIHEARHSDGSGEEIAFVHIHCPPGSPRAGLGGGCDFNLNGPWTLQAEYLEARERDCKDCTPQEHAHLKALIGECRSRVVKEIDFNAHPELSAALNAEIEESRPEKTAIFTILSRTTVLTQLKAQLEESKGILKATEWKSAHEPL